MDAAEFERLLKVALENKVDSFKLENGMGGKVDVVFTPSANYNEVGPGLAPANQKDTDELMLEHIEKLKSQALGGFQSV